jgi:hypothetical protein
MRQRAAILTAALLLAGLAGLAAVALHEVSLVQVRLARQGTVVDTVLTQAGERLCLKYIHSVERTPVQGWFAVDDGGGFRALRTKTTGTGTGLPNVVPEDRVRMDGQWLIVDEGGKHIPKIPFYFLPLNDLRISVGSENIDLSRVPPGSQLLITSKRLPAWRWALERAAGLVM